MKPSVIASVFYIVSFVGCATGVYRIKKTHRELYGATWIPVSALLVSFYQCIFAAFGTIVHIPVNLVSVGITNGVAAVVLWYVVLRRKGVQSYRYEKIDILAWLGVFLCVARAGYHRFGLDLHIRYMAIDPAQHFKNAFDMMQEQQVTAMYYASFHNGLLIALLAPFRDVTRYYQIYVLGDILWLLLAGLVFYGVIRKYLKDRYLKLAGVLATLIYICGYPLNSTVFGFTYLGMCVTIIGVTMMIVDGYIQGEFSKWEGVFMVSLCCLGVIECYVLFMPVVFFSILFCVLYRQKTCARLVSLDTVKVCLGIFLVPTVLGIYFTYRGIFGEGGTTVGSAFAQEGGIYKDLFSNFVLLIPFALYGYYHLKKERKNWIILYIFPLLVCFIFAMFGLGMTGRVSSYYFYKNYYLLWLVVFVLAFVGISYVEKKGRALVAMGAFMWLFTLFVGYYKIEDRIQNQNDRFTANHNSRAFCDIFMFNEDAIGNPEYPPGKIEIYRYAVHELKDTDQYIPIVCYWEDYFWMEAITGQRNNQLKCWDMEPEDFFARLAKTDYVMVLRDGEFYQQYQSYFDSLEKVYENEYGYIAKVEPSKKSPVENEG